MGIADELHELPFGSKNRHVAAVRSSRVVRASAIGAIGAARNGRNDASQALAAFAGSFCAFQLAAHWPRHVKYIYLIFVASHEHCARRVEAERDGRRVGASYWSIGVYDARSLPSYASHKCTG